MQPNEPVGPRVADSVIPAEPTLRAWLRRYGLKLVASIIIALAFAAALRRGGLPIIPPHAALARVDVTACAVYTLLFLSWHTVRATRWRYLLAPVSNVPLRRIIAVSWIGFAAILIMPLRAGEFVRPYMIREKGKLSMAAATGTVGAERIVDGLFLTVLLGVCLQVAHPLSPLPDHIGDLKIPVAAVPLYGYIALAAFLGAFALMALFCWRPKVGHLAVLRTLGLVSRRFAERAAEFVARTADGLRFLPSARHFAPFMLETAAYWVLNAFSMWYLARACGLSSITMVQACAVMGVLGVGILVPAGPGLFGAFQASAYAGLAMYFADQIVLGPGAVFVFLLYVIQCLCTLAAAAFFLVVDRGAARQVLEANSSP